MPLSFLLSEIPNPFCVVFKGVVQSWRDSYLNYVLRYKPSRARDVAPPLVAIRPRLCLGQLLRVYERHLMYPAYEHARAIRSREDVVENEPEYSDTVNLDGERSPAARKRKRRPAEEVAPLQQTQMQKLRRTIFAKDVSGFYQYASLVNPRQFDEDWLVVTKNVTKTDPSDNMAYEADPGRIVDASYNTPVVQMNGTPPLEQPAALLGVSMEFSAAEVSQFPQTSPISEMREVAPAVQHFTSLMNTTVLPMNTVPYTYTEAPIDPHQINSAKVPQFPQLGPVIEMLEASPPTQSFSIPAYLFPTPVATIGHTYVTYADMSIILPEFDSAEVPQLPHTGPILEMLDASPSPQSLPLPTFLAPLPTVIAAPAHTEVLTAMTPAPITTGDLNDIAMQLAPELRGVIDELNYPLLAFDAPQGSYRGEEATQSAPQYAEVQPIVAYDQTQAIATPINAVAPTLSAALSSPKQSSSNSTDAPESISQVGPKVRIKKEVRKPLMQNTGSKMDKLRHNVGGAPGGSTKKTKSAGASAKSVMFGPPKLKPSSNSKAVKGVLGLLKQKPENKEMRQRLADLSRVFETGVIVFDDPAPSSDVIETSAIEENSSASGPSSVEQPLEAIEGKHEPRHRMYRSAPLPPALVPEDKTKAAYDISEMLGALNEVPIREARAPSPEVPPAGMVTYRPYGRPRSPRSPLQTLDLPRPTLLRLNTSRDPRRKLTASTSGSPYASLAPPTLPRTDDLADFEGINFSLPDTLSPAYDIFSDSTTHLIALPVPVPSTPSSNTGNTAQNSPEVFNTPSLSSGPSTASGTPTAGNPAGNLLATPTDPTADEVLEVLESVKREVTVKLAFDEIAEMLGSTSLVGDTAS